MVAANASQVGKNTRTPSPILELVSADTVVVVLYLTINRPSISNPDDVHSMSTLRPGLCHSFFVTRVLSAGFACCKIAIRCSRKPLKSRGNVNNQSMIYYMCGNHPFTHKTTDTQYTFLVGSAYWINAPCSYLLKRMVRLRAIIALALYRGGHCRSINEIDVVWKEGISGINENHATLSLRRRRRRGRGRTIKPEEYRNFARMNEIAAASAMQWNVELDRGLRCQKPGMPFPLPNKWVC